ncbi:hypothetical protein [Reyranella sp.]|uniref:hypothetical protein n=1 Tax=Reyranella sp. TaxID=1929291 RepID=UPI003BAB5D88
MINNGRYVIVPVMSSGAFPSLLPKPVLPGCLPCFRPIETPSPEAARLPPRRKRWDARCAEILASDTSRSNAEVAALIEAATGLRFSVSVISRHRSTLGLDAPRHNDWTSPLRRWQPWQGHAARRR